MNLPHHRRALSGRTFSQPWDPQAVQVFKRPRWHKTWTFCFTAGVLFAFFALIYAEATP